MAPGSKVCFCWRLTARGRQYHLLTIYFVCSNKIQTYDISAYVNQKKRNINILPWRW
jgi:hypothetical protein